MLLINRLQRSEQHGSRDINWEKPDGGAGPSCSLSLWSLTTSASDNSTARRMCSAAATGLADSSQWV